MKINQLLSRFTSKERFVLTLGEDGAILLLLSGQTVKKRFYTPTLAARETASFTKILTSNPKIPLFLLLDTMDQTFSQQSFPPVGSFAIKGMIQRRLDRDFPSGDLKSAVPLGRSKTGKKEWRFLCVSVSQTSIFQEWLDFLYEQPNMLKGIYLLPLEIEPMAQHIHRHLHQGSKTLPKWQLIVSHNKLGGFRQVVLRDQKLIFTRLAQPIGDMTPDVIAGNIEQEIMSTLEYLKRLSMEEDEESAVYVIASQSIRDGLDITHPQFDHVHLLTPQDVATMLNLTDAAQANDHYGDVVLAVAFSTLRKHILRLTTPMIQKLQLLANARLGLRGVTALLVPFFLYLTVSDWLVMSEHTRDASFSQTTMHQSEEQLEALLKEKETLPDYMDKATDITRIYEALANKTQNPLLHFDKIAEKLVSHARLQEIEWESRESSESLLLNSRYRILFENRYKSIEEFLAYSNVLLQELKNQFPDHEIAYTQLPDAMADNRTLTTTFDGNTDRFSSQDSFEVWLSINQTRKKTNP